MIYRSRAKGQTEIGEGMYADDLVVIARSPGCLQQPLDASHKACANWDMSILVLKKLMFLVWATR